MVRRVRALLQLFALATLSALAAPSSPRKFERARDLLLASAALVIVEPLGPMLLGSIQPGNGARIRLAGTAAASVLALAALRSLDRAR